MINKCTFEAFHYRVYSNYTCEMHLNAWQSYNSQDIYMDKMLQYILYINIEFILYNIVQQSYKMLPVLFNIPCKNLEDSYYSTGESGMGVSAEIFNILF